MQVEFSIKRWSAWAPGLTTRDAWLEWAKAPAVAPRGPETPALSELPAMSRRRLDRLGRLAFQVAQEVQGDARGVPLVFASRFGEANRSCDLLDALAQETPLTPTGFALSVHNAIGSQYSILRADRASVAAVANGRFTAEAGVLEALGALGDGAEEVVLVAYELTLNARYLPWATEPDADFAFAWVLERGTAFSLTSLGAGPGTPGTLPHSLEVLRFLLSGDEVLERRDELAGFRWVRRA